MRKIKVVLIVLLIAAGAVYIVYPRRERSVKPTITYMMWGDKEEIEIAKELIGSFKKKNPNIEVKIIVANRYHEKLKTMIAGGTPPDIMYMGATELPAYVENGALLSIRSFIDNDKEIDLDDFYPIILNAFKYKGELYGLPKDFTPFLVYYNKTLFDKEGIPYPTEDWTWDDLLNYSIRLTKDTDRDGRIDQFGLIYTSWLEAFAPWVWQNGGNLMNEEKTVCTMDEPVVIEAMKFLQDLKFKYEVVPSVYSAPGYGTAGGQTVYQLFLTGKVGIYADVGRWITPRLWSIKDFEWDIQVMPRNKNRTAVVATTAYVISKDSKHPEIAYKLMKHLTTQEGVALNSRLGLAVPALKSIANSPAFLIPDRLPDNDRAFLRCMEYARLVPFHPLWQEFNQIFNEERDRCLVINKISAEQACKNIARKINELLAKKKARKKFPPMNFPAIFYGCLSAVGFVALFFAYRFFVQRRLPRSRRREELAGYFFILPWLIGFLLFILGPVLFSLLLSFCEWSAITPVKDIKFAGIHNFKEMFLGDPDFWQSLKVTFMYTAFSVPLGLVASLSVAILMNQAVKGIGLSRTIYYLPSVISGVAVAVLWWWLLNDSFGVINTLLRKIGIAHPPDWLQDEKWAIYAFVMMSLWGIGGGMIIYLAGLQNIPNELHEAAKIDGAGIWKRFRHITLPLLSPIIFFNLIIGIIGSFQVFTRSFIMTGGGPNKATLFYVLYLYRNAFEYHRMGYASAMAWILFLIILFFTLIVVKTSPKWVHYEGMRA